MLKRRKRVRVHMNDQTPSVEGLLVGRRHREYLIAIPKLLLHPDANPTELESRLLAIPRERVAFYEVI